MEPRRKSRDDASQREARSMDELAHWDELAEERLAALESDPLLGPRLEHLRRAEAFLQAAAGAPEACPTAEELYDFGRGPGYEPLPLERRRVIERHVDRCGECAGHVRSLATSPPLPLDVSPPLDAVPRHRAQPVPPAASSVGVGTRRDDAAGPFAAAEAASRPAPERRARPLDLDLETFAEPAERGARRSELGPHWTNGTGAAARPGPRSTVRRLKLVPLVATAAAAGLLALLWPTQRSRAPLAGTETGLPASPLLRGESAGPLLFPRGRVLAAPANAGLAGGVLDYADRPRFEIQPVEDATRYRVVVFRHEGGAFDAGRQVEAIDSDVHTMEAERALAPGHYTWEAWAVVNGLDQLLGQREFHVVEDDELCREVEGLDTVAAIRRLHEAGFLTDARALARNLPPTPERDAYLGALPGR